MVADINRPKLEDWKELVPESEAVLSNAEVIGGKLFLTTKMLRIMHTFTASTANKFRRFNCRHSVP